MYGTVARMRLKPGAEAEMTRLIRESAPQIPGFAFQHIYKLDSGSNEYFIVIGFTTKEAYVGNAKSPEQHARYQQYEKLLEIPPHWHDGEVISSTYLARGCLRSHDLANLATITPIMAR